MIYFGNLKAKSKRIAIRQIIISLLFITLFFSVSLLLYTNATSYINTHKSLDEVEKLFTELYQGNKDFLSSDNIADIYISSLKDSKNYQILENALNRLNANNFAKTNIIILDENLDISYSTFSDQRETDLRLNYTRAISNKTQLNDPRTVYNSVYKNSRGFPDLMMTRTVVDESETIGYITMFVSGYDWSYYVLSNLAGESVITDLEGNIIFYSKPSLMVNNYKFQPKAFKIHVEDNNFTVLSKTLEDFNIKIFSLNPSNNNSTLLYSFVFIFLIGLIWYRYSNRFANMIIEDNIKSINNLVSQINNVSDTRKNRVRIKSNDEYEYVAIQINSMLDRIDTLNKKNTELIEVNNAIEIKQLLSQYNPHFLYNTLEIIRSASHWQPKIADDLIIKLTNILKYSIDNTKKDVRLEEDMEYINSYLDIQKIRFEDRFNYSVNITEEAYKSIVIKLLLQPVIENSIKYGFQENQSVNLEIEAFVKAGVLILRVRDDGPGMSLEEIGNVNKASESGKYEKPTLGLYNISRRLRLQYSEQSGIKISNNEIKGITVEIRVAKN